MEKIKLFDLLEKSFLALRKTNKKIWIIGIIIALFSGGLIIEDSYDYGTSVDGYEYSDGEVLESEVYEDVAVYLIAIAIVIAITPLIIAVLTAFIGMITYYLYHSMFEALFDTKLERASLGLVVKVNIRVGLKVLLGYILFIIPGIIASVKYAPVNYILCKNPDLSSKEILNKTKEFSNGFKWKIFIYTAFIVIVTSIMTAICSPNLLIEGHILIDLLTMLIGFVITTVSVVYTGIFDMYLYESIEKLDGPLILTK